MEHKYPILGIDVSKATLDGCLLAEQGHRTSVQVKNTSSGLRALALWLRRQGVTDVTVCLEATNLYGAAVALFFHEREQTIVLANPTAVHAFMRATMQRAKTDKADADLIARYAAAMAERLRPWHPLPAEYDELRDLVRHLHDLTRCRAKAKNRMEKLAYLTSAAKTHIERSIRADLAHYEREIRLITKDIRACLHEHEAMQKRYDLITSTPGIGFVTAVTFMAEVPNSQQFTHPKQLAAYAGMTPRVSQSGQRQPASQPISKMGNRRLRYAFFMASLSARQYNKAITVCTSNHASKKPMVLQMAVARKLIHLLYAMEKHQRAYDPKYQKSQRNGGTN
ncbi:MAG: IS110 family transposase [Bacteroidota bacterium]|nr:IS110 family transposase [Bacteroidota bacterium]MDP4243345.1 IS110 family transposase [Bacteroidota bacterium]MDP4288826.1 IS110 family transposase [Bacteroidota bacterium]